MADSRPEPGPLTRTSTSVTPTFLALSAHCSAARWAANGVGLAAALETDRPGRVPTDDLGPWNRRLQMVVLLNDA